MRRRGGVGGSSTRVRGCWGGAGGLVGRAHRNRERRKREEKGRNNGINHLFLAFRAAENNRYYRWPENTAENNSGRRK